jgi:hypothetical protein
VSTFAAKADKMVFKLSAWKREQRFFSLAVDKEGKQLENRIWSCGKREPSDTVALLSGIPFFAAKSNKGICGGERKSSECRPRIDMEWRARRNPVAIAASGLGRIDRMARVSARAPSEAGKATELGLEATRSDVARV